MPLKIGKTSFGFSNIDPTKHYLPLGTENLISTAYSKISKAISGDETTLRRNTISYAYLILGVLA